MPLRWIMIRFLLKGTACDPMAEVVCGQGLLNMKTMDGICGAL